MPGSGPAAWVAPSTASAKWSCSVCGVSARGGGEHARGIGAGDHPASAPRSWSAVAAIKPAPGTERARHLATRVQQLQRFAARPGEARVDAAGARAVGDQLGRHLGVDLAPRADDDAQRVGPEPVPSSWLETGMCTALSSLVTRRARRADVRGALERDGIPLAPDAVRERLGEGADDGRDRVGGAPVVQVPPDVVARVHRRGGGALGGLHPVDVIEPVAVIAAGREAVDRLARSRRRSASRA